MSLVSSAKRHDLDVWKYVKDVLDQMLAGETDYRKLLPDRKSTRLNSSHGKLFSTVAGKPKVIEQTRSRTRHQRYKIRNRAVELLTS